MANECLFEKLKGTVENANLPVLESIQQFTLDAIARGGGMTLTNEQMYWLNHFFYAIGAIDNTPLWNKVAVCLIPIIGTTRANVVKDYRRDATLGSISSYVVNKAGGLELTFGGDFGTATGVYTATAESKVGFNAKAHTIFLVQEVTKPSETRQIKFIANYENSKTWKTGVNFNTNNDVPMVITTDGVNTQTVALTNQTNYYLTILGVGNGMFTIENIGNNVDNIESNYINRYPAPNSFDETQTVTTWPYVLLSSGYDIKLMLIINGVLSETEKQNVVKAINHLYNSFQ